ncbi:MAG: hypothetical protein QW540_10440 [Archaeoglobaceae archaeon]
MYLKLKGRLKLITRDSRGTVLDVLDKDNLIVKGGREAVAKLLCGVHPRSFGYIQIGTGTRPPSSDDTALESYYTEGRALTAYEPEYKAKWAYTFLFDESVTITEAGLFDAPITQDPVMLARQTFSGRVMLPGQTLEVVWVITVS